MPGAVMLVSVAVCCLGLGFAAEVSSRTGDWSWLACSVLGTVGGFSFGLWARRRA